MTASCVHVIIIDDPDDGISKQLCHKYRSKVPGIDYPTYERNWLSRGRTVIRLKIEKSITMDSRHTKEILY